MAWLAKLNGMWVTTRFLTWSPPLGSVMIERNAIAPSCQSTVWSALASGVTTTFAHGNGSVYGEVSAR